MANRNSTRRALLSSVMALFLCFAMLLGTTYAWFTDSVTSANNIIKSGTLEIAMDWADGKTDPANTTWTNAETGAIFNSTLWEPGYTEVRHIRITNEGSLALKYQIYIVANGEVSDLSDVIDVYYADPAVQITDRSMLTEDNKIGTLTEALANIGNTASGKLKAGEKDTVTLALKMREDAGNEYKDKSIGSSFSIVLMATQLEYETDGFDDQYDKDSLYPEVAIGNVTKEENASASVKTEDEDVKVDIPEGAPAGNYDLEVTDKKTTTDENGNTTLSMDISLKKDGAKVADDGTTVYSVSVYVGAGLTLTEVTHNGAAISDYEYDIVTGIITFETADFSPFAFTYKNEGYVAVANGKGYFAFADAIADAIQAGGAVTLLDNVVLENTITVPAGIALTLDLNGYTISQEKAQTEVYAMFWNKGTLTVKDSVGTGKISYRDIAEYTADVNYASNTIRNEGVLNIEGGMIENVTSKEVMSFSYPHAIDVYQGSTTNILGGTVKSLNYDAIRMFCNSTTLATTVNISGGTIINRVSFQNPNNNTHTPGYGILNITGGDFVTTDDVPANVRLLNFSKDYSNMKATITGGTFDKGIVTSDYSGGGVVTTKDWATVTGGTFGQDPSAYLASGYVTVQNADGTWTVLKGVSTFDELQTKLNEGGLVVLAADIDATILNPKNQALKVPAGVKVTLDLNGHKIIDKDGGQGNWMAIYVDQGAELTINDSVGTGEIISSCYGIYVKQNAKVVMNGGKLTVTGNGAFDMGIVLYNGEFVMNGGTIEAKIGVCASNYYKLSDASLPVNKITIGENATINASTEDFNLCEGASDEAPDTVIEDNRAND